MARTQLGKWKAISQTSTSIIKWDLIRIINMDMSNMTMDNIKDNSRIINRTTIKIKVMVPHNLTRLSSQNQVAQVCLTQIVKDEIMEEVIMIT